jgi:hypothetical protein
VCGGYFDLGIVIALVVLNIALATVPASEIETGFADLILARPLRRHWLITRTIALVWFATVVMLLMIQAGTWTGLALFAPSDAAAPSGRQMEASRSTFGMLGAVLERGCRWRLGAAFRRGVAGGRHRCWHLRLC